MIMKTAVIVLFLFTTIIGYSQTVLIDPTGDGGFENGTTFAANGWTVVNGTSSTSDYNRWVIGTDASPTDGIYCAYITDGHSGAYSTSAIYNYNYSGYSSADKCHIYKDISFPAGEELITLTFNWKCRGYWSTDEDYMRVYLVPTSITPTEDVALSSTYRIGELYYDHVTTWQSESITINPSYAGTTYRLVFSWTNTSSNNTQPPAAIDSIMLTSLAANMTYSSSTTTQASTANLCPGTMNNEIIYMQIETTNGLSNPLLAESFTFDTGTGSTDPASDISNAKLYYTGTSGSFSTANQVGSAYNGPSGAFTINGNQNLTLGTNYFWLAYDITPQATVGNSVDAVCNSITVSSSTYTPSFSDPAGVRNIPSGCAPGNDDCSNAWEIPLGSSIPASNENADIGIQPDDPNSIFEATCNSSVDNTVFFYFTTTTAGTYDVCFTDLSCNTPNGIQASIFNTDVCLTTNNWGSNLACAEPMNTNDFCVSTSGLAANTTYYVSVDGYAGCECSWNVSINNNPLPVELLDFHLELTDCSRELTWTTASEQNNDYFIVERNIDNYFEPIAIIAGNGNSNSILEYQYTDHDNFAEQALYRLKQVDYDGSTEILAPVLSSTACSEKSFANIFTDDNTLTIHYPNNDYSIEIFNFTGQMVYRQNANSETRITLNMFKSGFYICKISNGKYHESKSFLVD